MAIWKRAGSALCAAAAVAAVVGLSATPAIAATSLKVVVSHGGKITATTNKTILTDGKGTSAVSVVCTSSKKSKASVAIGSIVNGTHRGTPPVSVGASPKLSFNNCEGPLGAVHTKVLSDGKNGYTIAVDSATNKAGDTDGIIGPVKVNVSMTLCSFTVTGYAPGYFNNAKHELVVDSGKLPVKPLVTGAKAQLTISNVSGCAGIVTNNQHPTYNGTYTLGKSKVTVKSSS